MTTIKAEMYTESWTLGKMWDFDQNPHMEVIVRYIEPKLIRGTYLPCWIWVGKYAKYGAAKEYQYPIVYIPEDIQKPTGEFNKIRQHHVRRFMYNQFFELEPGFVVYQSSDCTHMGCVNPRHAVGSYRNDPQYHR